MCGIAGIFNYSGSESPKLDSIIQMTNEMNNRGPDDEGYFLDSGSIQIPLAGPNTPASSKQTTWNPREPAGSYLQLSSIVSLGHRRLAIQDLTPAGHQPLSTQDGRYWIVFNGEIYNKEEIANELKSLGVQFVGTSDTEVLINAYSSWGERCLSKLNGAFAFSIWDTRNQEMFCARDRLGIKPFYFTNTPTFFMFGSTIRSLLCSGLIKATPDDQGLYLSMAFGIAPRPITAFKNIYALEQSHWMKIKRDGSIIKNRYWEIPTCNQNQEMTLGEAKELLDFELARSIKSRLLSDVPVGTFMSGGIDSTTVSAIASQFQPDIKAFTLGYEGVSPAMNEVEQASKTASMHNMNHIINYIKPITSIPESTMLFLR
jgi:asparagine synthase (glutamine-hydrolysing)